MRRETDPSGPHNGGSICDLCSGLDQTVATIQLTMSNKKKYPRAAAMEVAAELCRALRPSVDRLIVAGSLRRRKLEVGDVEVLFIPKFSRRVVDLFYETNVSLADETLERLLTAGIIQHRPNVNGSVIWGEKNKLADNSQRLTRVFYEETSKHIDEAKLTTKERVDLKNHLVSYLKSQDNIINPRTFADRYLPKPMHDTYFVRVKKAGLPARDVSKNTHQIRRKLQVRRMFFSSKVRISAPEENFYDVVKIVETKDGWTTLKINGELEAQT